LTALLCGHLNRPHPHQWSCPSFVWYTYRLLTWKQ